MRTPSLFLFLSASTLLAATGCDVDTNPNIFVAAAIEDPYVDVQKKGDLGADITGGFTLTLDLGARAADSTEVSLEGFELVSKDEKTLIVSPLPLTAEGVTFPIVVEPGTKEAIEILIDYGNKLATKAEGDKLCSFGEVRFRGSISDSLQGTSEPIPPNLVDVTGCQ